MTGRDPKRRFSDRVQSYARYRPGYPWAVVETLAEECGLSPGSVVADVGSGTGILSKLFLDAGYRVLGVEPNAEMREAAEKALRGYPRFESVPGTAEETTLPDRSAELVTAGQAFHWFDRGRALEEFKRVLVPGGSVALVWNVKTEDTPFMQAYERLLQKHGTDYNEVTQRRLFEGEGLGEFFEPEGYARKTFRHEQVFDFEGLKGRLLSSSFVPGEGEPGSGEMLEDLAAVFGAHEKAGRVTFGYETRLYHGRPA